MLVWTLNTHFLLLSELESNPNQFWSEHVTCLPFPWSCGETSACQYNKLILLSLPRSGADVPYFCYSQLSNRQNALSVVKLAPSGKASVGKKKQLYDESEAGLYHILSFLAGTEHVCCKTWAKTPLLNARQYSPLKKRCRRRWPLPTTYLAPSLLEGGRMKCGIQWQYFQHVPHLLLCLKGLHKHGSVIVFQSANYLPLVSGTWLE